MPVYLLPIAVSAWQFAFWVCLAAFFTATIVAVRSRWARERPIHRCVLLSLAAHLVLIALAATIRLVSWPPGAGEDEPVRITIVASSLPQAIKAPPKEPATEQPDEQPETQHPEEIQNDKIKDVSHEEEPTQQSDDPPAPDVTDLAAPELMPEPDPPQPDLPEPSPSESNPSESTPPESPSEPTDEAAPTVVDARATEPAPEPPPKTFSESAAATEAPAAPPTSTAASEASAEPATEAAPAVTPAEPAVPASLAERVQADRLQSVLEQGGSRETEQAVGRALEWLARAQSSDGRWDCDRWQGGREFLVLGENRRGAGSQADTGVSGLALLTFLGAGHTHLDGPYRRTVAQGLGYLIRSQADNGDLCENATFYARTYCHSMATFALAEAYALTGDERLEPTVRRAVHYLLQTENKSTGGWRYNAGDQGDVSQLGWIIMALRSAELAGVQVPDDTWNRIERFLSRVARGQHGGLAAYQARSAWSRPMTAEAMYCRYVLGKPLSGAALDESLAALAGELPGDGLTNFYYWYYATLALHHTQHQSSAARHTWDRWNEALKKSLVNSQVKEGSNGGSWSPNTVWGGYGGRVYSTSMAAMCLEVYYRFGSEADSTSPWVASQPRGELK